jgi:hypothetical protein
MISDGVRRTREGEYFLGQKLYGKREGQRVDPLRKSEGIRYRSPRADQAAHAPDLIRPPGATGRMLAATGLTDTPDLP